MFDVHWIHKLTLVLAALACVLAWMAFREASAARLHAYSAADQADGGHTSSLVNTLRMELIQAGVIEDSTIVREEASS